MLSRLPWFALRVLPAAAALLAVILVVTAWPARHALAPLWPEPVDEWLLADSQAGVERRFLARAEPPDSPEVLARSRPISLWRVETRTGEIVHAWLVGVRDAETGALLPETPRWLSARRIDAPLPPSLSLVFAPANGEHTEIASAAVTRMFRPNALEWTRSLELALDRFLETWRWPFSEPEAEQTASPG